MSVTRGVEEGWEAIERSSDKDARWAAKHPKA